MLIILCFSSPIFETAYHDHKFFKINIFQGFPMTSVYTIYFYERIAMILRYIEISKSDVNA